MPFIEFEGKNTEEAIEKACNQLHRASDELKFEILSTGSSGIFGLGGKNARIKVLIEEKISKKEKQPESVEKKEETMSAEPRDEVRPERKPRRENRREESARSERRKPRPQGRRPQSPRIDEERERESEPEPVGVPENLPIPPTVAGPGEEIYEGPEDEPMSKAKEALSGILQHMEIEGGVDVLRIGERIILNVTGENSGLLIGKKGTTLDALQFLINKIVNKSQTGKYRVIVDTENYRQRRHQSLIDLARRMAEKAKRGKRPVTISQLSANDRRVVHLALQEMPGLKTRSRGEGPMKNIVIIPGGKRNGPRGQAGRPRVSEDMREKKAGGENM